jgi:hypothetical protein
MWMPLPCRCSDMKAAFTLYPPGLTGRRARISGHRNVPGMQEYQGARPGGALRPPVSKAKQKRASRARAPARNRLKLRFSL